MPPAREDRGRIAAYIEKLRRRLVDLTGRNKLLAFRPQKRSSLELLHPAIETIWKRLLDDEGTWKLLPGIVADDEKAESQVDSEITKQQCETAAGRGNLAIKLQPKKLEANARHIRRQAVEMIDETGTNHLFLAMGFLKWYESKDSNVERMAPLLLLPVTMLEHKGEGGGKAWFDITHDGTELAENLSLNLRLDEEFSVSLPAIKADDTPEKYFKRVEKAIAKQTGWEVVRTAHLAFFSFAKLRMYQDLDPAIWPDANSLVDNPLIRSLLDGSERNDEDPAYGAVEVHDGHETAHDIPLVCEADSSQHTAILKVVEGRNTVIEGPPGTGKSQTITNIIAAAMSQGKSVLFVSEKKAALDVVHSNLSHHGLGDFCLELHASKSSKAQVHASFRKRNSGVYPHPRQIEIVRSQWTELKTGLAEYVNAAGTEGGPWAEPLYSSFGRAISLREQGLPSYRKQHKGELPEGDLLATRMHFLQMFAHHLHNPEVFRDHPWKGFRPTLAGPGDEDEIGNLFARFFAHVRKLSEIECEFGEKAGVEDCLPNRVVTAAMLNFPEHLEGDKRHVYGPGLSAFHDTTMTTRIRRVLGVRDAYFVERGKATKVLTDAATDDDGVVAHLENATVELKRVGLDKCTLAELIRQSPAIIEAADVLTQFNRIATRLNEFGLGQTSTLRALKGLSKTLSLAANAPNFATKHLGQNLLYPSASDTVNTAEAQLAVLRERETNLNETFAVKDAPSTETLASYRKELRATGGSVFSVFNGEYRKTRKSVYAFLQSRKSFKIPAILEELARLETYQIDAKEFDSSALFTEALGSAFKGADTDWTSLKGLIEWCQAMAAEALPYPVVEKIATEASQVELKQLVADLTQNLERLERVRTEAEMVLFAALEVTSIDTISTITSHGFLAQWSEWFRDTLGRTKSMVTNVESRVAAIATATKSAKIALAHSADLESDDPFKTAFGELARGLQSNWSKVEATVAWVETIDSLNLPGSLRDWLLDAAFDERTANFVATLRLAVAERKTIEDILGEIQNFGPLDRDWLFGAPEHNWREMVPRCERLMDARRLVPQWVVHQKLRASAEGHQVTLFSDKAIKGDYPISRMPDVYALTLAERHGFSDMSRHASLSTFSHRAFEASRTHFAQTDKKLLELNRKQVAAKNAGRNVPRGNGVGPVGSYTERSLVEHEMGKQQKHIPIRQLMKRSAQAIRALKPCIMMSPLSVAQYLDPSLPKFDLVVMDEASQIRPEDALGAVARGHQLVVVGDTKQMPPSALWQKQLDDDADEEEDSAAQDSESVLECALHSFHPVYRLKWHYRSLHEDLIKFSNATYYDNELIIFPTARANDESLGIRFHHIPDGRFQSGARVNMVEANIVAEAVVRQLMTRPQESLLVATMNRPQQDAVEDCIDRICATNPTALATVEEARNRDFEKFIVRNLENIQGDQRDVVFISFTYGKDPQAGVMAQRFNQLSGKSGRRRLNVLFSRAKMRLDAFSSMVSADITGRPGELNGVNDLKNYLRFAQEGVLYEEGTNTKAEPDSDFEVSVINVIRSAGLVAVPQVGVASYRVDIGVCLPGQEGSYILGIECDGATYHSSKSARDRDRIREEILISRGWKLHRIWSTDWFRQHEDAKMRLLSALKAASNGNGTYESSSDSDTDDDLPVVTLPACLSKIAAVSGYSIYEIRSIAWRLARFAGEDSENLSRKDAIKISSEVGCRVG